MGTIFINLMPEQVDFMRGDDAYLSIPPVGPGTGLKVITQDYQLLGGLAVGDELVPIHNTKTKLNISLPEEEADVYYIVPYECALYLRGTRKDLVVAYGLHSCGGSDQSNNICCEGLLLLDESQSAIKLISDEVRVGPVFDESQALNESTNAINTFNDVVTDILRPLNGFLDGFSDRTIDRYRLLKKPPLDNNTITNIEPLPIVGDSLITVTDSIVIEPKPDNSPLSTNHICDSETYFPISIDGESSRYLINSNCEILDTVTGNHPKKRNYYSKKKMSDSKIQVYLEDSNGGKWYSIRPLLYDSIKDPKLLMCGLINMYELTFETLSDLKEMIQRDIPVEYIKKKMYEVHEVFMPAYTIRTFIDHADLLSQL